MNINNPMIFVHSVDEQRVFANRQAYSDFLLEFVAMELKDFSKHMGQKVFQSNRVLFESVFEDCQSGNYEW